MNAAVHSALIVRRDRLWPVIVVSLAVHAALLAALALHRPAPQIDLGQKPIVAKLVRLGEKRPQNLLPRKDEPADAPPAAAAPVPIPVAKPEPPAPAKPAPTVPSPKAVIAPPPPRAAPRVAAAPSAGRDVLASVLSRVKRDRALQGPVYGDPSGDPMGDSNEASEGDQYLALVVRTLQNTYVVPATISERDRMHLTATLVLFIDSDGSVLQYEFADRSGNGAFDSALERAVRAARLPPPPPQFRQRFRKDGLQVKYRTGV
ncbi:MAG: TonB C-terminal domain-containing protein [Anaeromyxobacteraceae bacterium]